MHDNDKPICSAEQTAWVELVDAMRQHLVKMARKPKLTPNQFGALTTLTSEVMNLHLFASTFDLTMKAQANKMDRRGENRWTG